MSQLPILCLKMQIQTFALQCEGLKEYEADWLKNAKTVTRDASGRFASKASDVGKAVGDNTKALAKEVQIAITDPKRFKGDVERKLEEFRKAMLSQAIISADKTIAKMQQVNPEMADYLSQTAFGKSSEEIQKLLAESYEKLNPQLAKAIKVDHLKRLKEDWKKAVETKDPKLLGSLIKESYAMYEGSIDKLANLDKSNPLAVRLMGKAAAAMIPVAAYMAIAAGPEIAIGLATGEALGVTAQIAIASASWSWMADTAMNFFHVDNPLVRIGVQLAVGGVSRASVEGQLSKAGIEKAGKAMTINKSTSAKPFGSMPSAETFAKLPKEEFKSMNAEGTSTFSKTVIDGKEYFVKHRRDQSFKAPDILDDKWRYAWAMIFQREEMAKAVIAKNAKPEYEVAASAIASALKLEKYIPPVQLFTASDGVKSIATPMMKGESLLANRFKGTAELLDKPSTKIIEDSVPPEDLQKLILFDFLTQNGDRHAGNIFVTEDGLKFIDHELAFQQSKREAIKLKAGGGKPAGFGMFTSFAADPGFEPLKGLLRQLVINREMGLRGHAKDPIKFSPQVIDDLIAKEDEILQQLESAWSGLGEFERYSLIKRFEDNFRRLKVMKWDEKYNAMSYLIERDVDMAVEKLERAIIK